ncbi:hypothetical protein QBC32DRAFT_212405, partial [Pseudoneurospora amorphoporcata]
SRILTHLRASDGASFPNWARGLMSRDLVRLSNPPPPPVLSTSRIEDGVITRRDLWAHQPERLESLPNAAAMEPRGHDCVRFGPRAPGSYLDVEICVGRDSKRGCTYI